jgi:ribosome biogenesis GTPase
MAKFEKARVCASTGSWYRLLDETGTLLQARLRGKMRLGAADVTNPVAVGDYVEIERNKDGTASIVSVLDRENEFVRESTHRKNDMQVLAANLDLAVVVMAFRAPKYKFGFIDRFLVTCEAYHVPALIVINKNDLSPEDSSERDTLVSTYKSPGYEVLFTSTSNPYSIDAFRKKLQGKTTLLIGQSGVGKSSLINALSPTQHRKTGVVSDFNEKGKHTTTFAEMITLDEESFIIDTPGLREFGLAGFEPHELSYFFPEMEPLKHTCKLKQCLCVDEPGCPVQAAFEEGAIQHSRMDSYLQMLGSLQEQK